MICRERQDALSEREQMRLSDERLAKAGASDREGSVGIQRGREGERERGREREREGGEHANVYACMYTLRSGTGYLLTTCCAQGCVQSSARP